MMFLKRDGGIDKCQVVLHIAWIQYDWANQFCVGSLAWDLHHTVKTSFIHSSISAACFSDSCGDSSWRFFPRDVLVVARRRKYQQNITERNISKMLTTPLWRWVQPIITWDLLSSLRPSFDSGHKHPRLATVANQLRLLSIVPRLHSPPTMWIH